MIDLFYCLQRCPHTYSCEHGYSLHVVPRRNSRRNETEASGSDAG
jgi:hypothetical protein